MEETSFLTIFYGLYFSHHYIHFTHYKSCWTFCVVSYSCTALWTLILVHLVLAKFLQLALKGNTTTRQSVYHLMELVSTVIGSSTIQMPGINTTGKLDLFTFQITIQMMDKNCLQFSLPIENWIIQLLTRFCWPEYLTFPLFTSTVNTRCTLTRSLHVVKLYKNENLFNHGCGLVIAYHRRLKFSKIEEVAWFLRQIFQNKMTN